VGGWRGGGGGKSEGMKMGKSNYSIVLWGHEGKTQYKSIFRRIN